MLFLRVQNQSGHQINQYKLVIIKCHFYVTKMFKSFIEIELNCAMNCLDIFLFFSFGYFLFCIWRVSNFKFGSYNKVIASTDTVVQSYVALYSLLLWSNFV